MKRVVLVTGACGGIGSVLCRRFVQDGATVLALDVDAATPTLCANASHKPSTNAVPSTCSSRTLARRKG